MAMLLLDRAHLEVRTDGPTLALYENAQRRGTVPVALLDQCIIQGSDTQISSAAIMKLAEAGVTTLVMSPRQTRRAAIILGTHHNDAAVRLAQAQCVLDDAWCRAWALSVVRAKLARQQRTLRTFMAERPDARKPLFDAIQTLHTLRTKIDESNLDVPPELGSLRGMEGSAARAYFAALAAVMPPDLAFAARNRRPPRDPVNACLSLGYTLLHAQAVAACLRSGLDPLLGFYHRPTFGRESLASDLIEPLRPCVDAWVWELLRQRQLQYEHFSFDQGACLLGKAGRNLFYAQWQTVSRQWSRWLRLRVRLLAQQLRHQGEPWLAPDQEDEPC